MFIEWKFSHGNIKRGYIERKEHFMYFFIITIVLKSFFGVLT